MASTFTTGFGIEKIGSGEQSGTWGTTTNHNFDIIDRIASYKAVAITTNADTATLTVREASPGSGTENLQDGMYRVIKFTGALDSNCTVTIAPNTAPAWFIIENATTDSGSSGPYSLILSQGSGANVTVQNGKNAISTVMAQVQAQPLLMLSLIFRLVRWKLLAQPRLTVLLPWVVPLLVQQTLH